MLVFEDISYHWVFLGFSIKGFMTLARRQTGKKHFCCSTLHVWHRPPSNSGWKVAALVFPQDRQNSAKTHRGADAQINQLRSRAVIHERQETWCETETLPSTLLLFFKTSFTICSGEKDDRVLNKHKIFLNIYISFTFSWTNMFVFHCAATLKYLPSSILECRVTPALVFFSKQVNRKQQNLSTFNRKRQKDSAVSYI